MPKKPTPDSSNPIERLVSEIKSLLLHPPRDRKARVELPERLKYLMNSLIHALSIMADRGETFQGSLDKAFFKALLTHDEIINRSVCILHLMVHLRPESQMELLELGVMPYLSKLIISKSHEPLRSEAITLFITIANHPQSKLKIIELGGMPILLFLAQDPDRLKRMATLHMLHHFSSDSLAGTLNIIRANGVQQLLAFIEHHDAPADLLILKIIETCHLQEEAIAMFGLPEINTLLNCLNGSILEIEAEASVILSNLIAFDPLLELIVNHHGISSFVKRLDAHSTLLQKGVTASLFHLAIHNDSCRQSITEAGAIPMLSDLLLNTDIRLYALKTIGALSAHPASALEMNVSRTLLPRLFLLLESDDKEMAVEILNTVLQIIDNDAPLLCNQHTIPLLLRLMAPENAMIIRQRATLVLLHFRTEFFHQTFLSSGGLQILISIISSEPNVALKSQALLKCIDFIYENQKKTKELAENLVELGLVEHLMNLLAPPIGPLIYHVSTTLIYLLFHIPSLSTEFNADQLKTFLTLLSHKNPKSQQRTAEVLLNISNTVTNARALALAGGIPFLIKALMQPEQQNRAALALINIAALDSSDMTFDSKNQFQPFIQHLQTSESKQKKRVTHALANLAASPKYATFLYELGAHIKLVTLLKNTSCAPFARRALDHMSRISLQMDRNIAIYEYALNETIHGALPIMTQPIPEPTAPSPTTIKKRTKSEKKAKSHALKIGELQSEIQDILRALTKPIDPFPYEEASCPRKTMIQLQSVREALKQELQEFRSQERIRVEDASKRAEVLIEQLYNGRPTAQVTAAQMLMVLAKDVRLKEGISKKIDEEQCQPLAHYAHEELKSEMSSLFEFLFHRRLEGVTDFPMKPTLSKLTIDESSPQLKIILDIHRCLSHSEKPLFDTITPCIVGSQVRRLQKRLPFDPTCDWDFEFFCTSIQHINPVHIKEHLLAHILPPRTKITYWNSAPSFHEFGFQMLNEIDLKFSIYAEHSPKVQDYIQHSQINRRLINRASIYDLNNQMLFAYDQRWRGFTNKYRMPTPEDYGYALYDLAIEKMHAEKGDALQPLLNEPHFRVMLTTFFQKTIEDRELAHQETAKDYAIKRLRNKLRKAPEAAEGPTEKAQSLIRVVLLDFGINQPVHLFRRTTHPFFRPEVRAHKAEFTTFAPLPS